MRLGGWQDRWEWVHTAMLVTQNEKAVTMTMVMMAMTKMGTAGFTTHFSIQAISSEVCPRPRTMTDHLHSHPSIHRVTVMKTTLVLEGNVSQVSLVTN